MVVWLIDERVKTFDDDLRASESQHGTWSGSPTASYHRSVERCAENIGRTLRYASAQEREKRED
jgi:hypothetical protein